MKISLSLPLSLVEKNSQSQKKQLVPFSGNKTPGIDYPIKRKDGTFFYYNFFENTNNEKNLRYQQNIDKFDLLPKKETNLLQKFLGLFKK